MYMSSKHSTDEAKENITFKIFKENFKSNIQQRPCMCHKA